MRTSRPRAGSSIRQNFVLITVLFWTAVLSKDEPDYKNDPSPTALELREDEDFRLEKYYALKYRMAGIWEFITQNFRYIRT